MPEPQQEPPQDAPPPPERVFGLQTRLLWLATLLGALAVLLGSTVVGLQLYLVRTHLQRKQQRPKTASASAGAGPSSLLSSSSSDSPAAQAADSKDVDNVDVASSYSRSVQPMLETTDLYLYKNNNTENTASRSSAAQAYWNQVAPYIASWDVLLEPTTTVPRSSGLFLSPQQQEHLEFSLQQAAELGHPLAQHMMANMLASGISPLLHTNSTSQEVPTDMVATYNSQPSTTSWLYWHLSAMQGHVESALSLGYRYRLLHSTHASLQCTRALPYLEAAAHGIVDFLESSQNSRAKVPPPVDTHVLSDLHISHPSHWQNSPDEPKEALEYYHLRSVQQDDVSAAYTLAHLYHYGARGVSQNLTLALEYYERAARLDHWEAAGQAGKFYLWGMGLDWKDRNLYKAHKLFQKGAPWGAAGCLQRHKRKKVSTETITCDHPCVNGMGILHLIGVPMIVPRDLDKAVEYFTVARDMGNMDASYHLAMIRLGYKSYFVELDQLRDESTSKVGDSSMPDFMQDNDKGSGGTLAAAVAAARPGPTKADYLVALQDLLAAANKGHLQARHRLGMMYSHGVNGTTAAGVEFVGVAPDCSKALKHFTWLAENANPGLALRTRRAYKLYMAGDYEGSLRNYLAAAETGSELSQINAAFLLEQGVCLGLSQTQCAAASLRLWKAAVGGKNAEASLRVGDVYYYGRLRSETGASWYGVGPFGWLPLVLYPEKHLVPLVRTLLERGVKYFQNWLAPGQNEDASPQAVAPKTTCEAGEEEDGTCFAIATNEPDDDKEASSSSSTLESDLAMAATYYQLAAEKHKSPRANFNLGFMHEWGLGLKQDFPLAKRHYDLAASNNGEAAIAVQIALTAMKLHERILKFYVEWNERSKEASRDENNPISNDDVPRAAERVGHPLPSRPDEAKTISDVVLSHVFSWETLLIVVLTVVLSKLLQHRRTRR